MRYIVLNISPEAKSYVRALYSIPNIEDYYALIPYDVHPYLVEKLSVLSDHVNFSVIDIGPDDIDEISHSFNFNVIGVSRPGKKTQTVEMDGKRCLLFNSSKRYPRPISQSLKTSFVGDESDGANILVTSTLLDDKPLGWNESDNYEAIDRSSLDQLRIRARDKMPGTTDASGRNRISHTSYSVPAFIITSGLIGASWLCALSASHLYKKI